MTGEDERRRELDRLADAGDRDAAVEALKARVEAGELDGALAGLVRVLDWQPGDDFDRASWARNLVNEARRADDEGSWTPSTSLHRAVARAAAYGIAKAALAHTDLAHAAERLSVGRDVVEDVVSDAMAYARDVVDGVADPDDWRSGDRTPITLNNILGAWEGFTKIPLFFILRTLVGLLALPESYMRMLMHVSDGLSHTYGASESEARRSVRGEVALAALRWLRRGRGRGGPRRNQFGLALQSAELARDEAVAFADLATDEAAAPSRRRGRRRRRNAGPDLQAISDDVNRRFFGGRIKVGVGWSRRPITSRWAVYKRFSDGSELIEVNVVLRRDDVPLEVLEFQVYHEMLHVVVPSGHFHHTPEFKRREREFPGFEAIQKWQKDHLSLVVDKEGIVKALGRYGPRYGLSEDDAGAPVTMPDGTKATLLGWIHAMPLLEEDESGRRFSVPPDQLARHMGKADKVMREGMDREGPRFGISSADVGRTVRAMGREAKVLGWYAKGKRSGVLLQFVDGYLLVVSGDEAARLLGRRA